MMTMTFRAALLLLTLCLPLCGSHAQSDSTSNNALFKVLIATLASAIATEKPRFGDEHTRASAWSIWEIQSSQVTGRPTEIAFQNAVLKANGARLRTSSDTIWTVLSMQGIQIIGNTAVVRLDRGTRWCSRVNGLGASGLTHLYTFRRVKQKWQYAGEKPDIAYDPSPAMPERGPYQCGVQRADGR